MRSYKKNGLSHGTGLIDTAPLNDNLYLTGGQTLKEFYRNVPCSSIAQMVPLTWYPGLKRDKKTFKYPLLLNK